MRIIGNIEHPHLKITVFKMDNKLSVKFESGLYEQTFKFRTQDGLENFEDMQKLVDEDFMDKVLTDIQEMHQTRNKVMSRFLKPMKANEFEEII